MINVLSHHVDTFKEALYLSGDCIQYNKLVDSFIDSKNQAQEIHDQNNENRFVNYTIGDYSFKVMATSISGYSVVIKNGDVSIALKKRGDVKSDKNPSIKIEYRSSFLTTYGIHAAQKKVTEFIVENIHKTYISKVQEVHLASDIQNYRFSLYDIFSFKTRNNRVREIDADENDLTRSSYFVFDTLETFYLGGSSNKLRIYDKTREMQKHPDSQHIKRIWELNPNYDNNKDVFRIEFQLRRDVLKTIFTNEKLSFEYTDHFLENIPTLWAFCINYFSFRDISRNDLDAIITGIRTLKNGSQKLLTREAKRKIRSRSNIHPLWEAINFYKNIKPDYFFRFRQTKESSPLYAMNSVSALVSTIVKHYGDCTPALINEVVNMAETRNLNNKEEFLIDSAMKKRDQHFSKIELQGALGLRFVPENDCIKDNLGYYISDSLAQIPYEIKEKNVSTY